MANSSLKWNALDSLLVAFTVLDTIMTAAIDFGPDVQGFRVVRLIRLVRLLRIVRALRAFRDLRIMVSGIVSSLKPFMWCMLLLVVLMFAVSLIVVQLLMEGLDTIDREFVKVHYSSLFSCMYTLFGSLTGGFDWDDVAAPLVEMNWIVGPLFIAYIGFAMLCVLNVVTCVFVDKANQFTKTDLDNMVMEEMATREQWMKDMAQIFTEADSDGSARLEKEEFTTYIQDIRVQAYFRSIGLNIETENALAFFSLLDLDNAGSISLEDFMDGCAQFIGTARQLDVARNRMEVVKVRRQVAELQEALEIVVPALAKTKSKRAIPSFVSRHTIPEEVS